MTYEEKFDAVTSFCDKYGALIDEAKEGTDLYALKELCDAFDEVSRVETSIWKETTDSLKAHLVNVMLHIAETYANELEMKTPNELRAEMGLPPVTDTSEMVRLLDCTMTDLDKVREWDCVNLVRARKNVAIVKGMIVETLSDENQDIELYAADPADGENWTVSSKQEEEKKTEEV